MTKQEAIDKLYEKFGSEFDSQYDAVDITGVILPELLDFLVDELKMLPPTTELKHFPGKKDNIWEDK